MAAWGAAAVGENATTAPTSRAATPLSKAITPPRRSWRPTRLGPRSVSELGAQMPGELSGQVAAHTQVHYVAGLNFCVFASMIVYPRNTKRRNHPPGSSGFFPAEMNPSGRHK